MSQGEYRKFFDNVICGLTSPLEEKRAAAIRDLETQSGFDRLVPEFMKFAVGNLSEESPDSMRVSLWVAHSLVRNANVGNAHENLYEIFPRIMECLLADREYKGHLDFREAAASFVADCCKAYGGRDVAQTGAVMEAYKQAFTGGGRCAQLGACLGIGAFGKETSDKVLSPLLSEPYLKALSDSDEMNSLNVAYAIRKALGKYLPPLAYKSIGVEAFPSSYADSFFV